MKLPPQLQKKLGPLPVWAWAVILIGGFLVMRFLKARAATVDAASVEDNGEAISGDVSGTIGGAYGGGSVGGSAPGDPGVSLDAVQHDGITSDDLGLIAGTISDAIGQAFSRDEGTIVASENGGVITQSPAAVAPGATVPKPQTFQWEGKTYAQGDKSSFQKFLNSRGVSYSQWVKNHPDAAQRVFGDNPSILKKSPVAVHKAAAPKPPTESKGRSVAPHIAQGGKKEAPVHAAPIPPSPRDDRRATAPTVKVATKPPAVAPKKADPPHPKYETFKKDVKVGPGQSLKFTKDKGYYAG